MISDKEEWKTFYLDGIKTRYEISSYGRVFDTKYDKLVSLYLEPKGYYRCSLTIAKKMYVNMLVHRMVAMMYVNNPNPEEYDVVDHIDGNKTNNHYSNLRWCTKSMNSKYAIELGLINPNNGFGEDSWNHKYDNEQIKQAISMMNGLYTSDEISEATGISKPTIYALSKGTVWSHLTKGKNLSIKMKRNYISEEDLTRAIELLKTGKYSLKEVSELCNMNKRTVAAIINKKIHSKMTKGLKLSARNDRKSLDVATVLKVIDLLDGRHSYDDIIKETGATQNTIYRILKRLRWSKLSEGKSLSIKR